MTGHPKESELNELLDGTLPPDERARVERHVGECVPCTMSLRSLDALVGRARALPRDMVPPPEAWVAVRTAVHGSPRRAEPVARIGRWPMVAAAAALVLISVVTTLWLTDVSPDGPPARSADVRSATPAALAVFGPVEARYVLAVSALHETLEERRDQLDPATIETVERSLATIDAAIAEARDALASDPANATLTRLLQADATTPSCPDCAKLTRLRQADATAPR